MPIFEHTYHPYDGPRTEFRRLPLAIARRGLAEAFASRLVALLLGGAGIATLVFAILIYLHYNAAAIHVLRLAVARLVPINAQFFSVYLGIESVLAFFLALWLGPPAIARDQANNALPLYFSRPITRPQYLWGKMLPLLLLLSAVTWLPGLFLFVLQASLAGTHWFAANLHIAAGIFLGSLVWIVLLSLLANALSASLKRRWPATAALVGLFFIPGIVGGILDNFLTTPWGRLLSPLALMRIIWQGLFRLNLPAYGLVPGPNGHRVLGVLPPVPAWSAWLVVALLAAGCLALLARSLRPYPPIR